MNRQEIKHQHLVLHNKQPFTQKELNTYSKKDQSMIRNIQILNNISKKEAISVIKSYKRTPKDTLKLLAKTYRKRLKKYSSPQKPEIRGTTPKLKNVTSRKKNIYKENRNGVQKYLQSFPLNKTDERVKKGFKKYLDASKYELQHGVNSKASQNYRVKRGLNQKYEGRIVK